MAVKLGYQVDVNGAAYLKQWVRFLRQKLISIYDNVFKNETPQLLLQGPGSKQLDLL